MLTQQKSNTTILSTVTSDTSIDDLQKNLEKRRDILLEGYLAQDFHKMESILAQGFRYINGKQIRTRENWHEILATLWESGSWQEHPMLPERTRYHFFTLTECMVTLYFKNEKYANVMQELWMKDGNVWKLSALSLVNR